MEFNFFYSHLISIPSVAFLLAVIIKWFSSIFHSWKFDIKKALSSWWMPSVHSAVVTSLTTRVALKYWISSDLFAISLGFTVIIIYDAINIRYEAWLHAIAINKLLWEKFKESLGHLPSEAFAWSLLWILTAVFLFYI
jgi:hypothetical protein